MKNHFFFVLAFLCLYFTGSLVFAQTNSKNVLEQPITLSVQNETLENIFSELSKKYNVRFSYSNSRLPLQRKINVNVVNLPLKEVLTQIFEPLNDENTQIQFRLINGQIVIQAKSNIVETEINKENLKKELEKGKNPQIVSLPKEPLVIDKTNEKNTSSKEASVSTKNKIVDEKDIKLIEKNTTLDSLEKNKLELAKADSLNKIKNIKEIENTKDMEDIVNTENHILDTTKIAKTDSLITQESEELAIVSKLNSVPLQVTLIYPLGTNGSKSPYKNNNFSFNLLAGYNGSVTGFEVGSFANILKENVRGFQVAGFTNIVGGKTKGFQVAGFTNISKDSVSAFQAAGFLNINGNSTKGFQAAGFMNMVNGDFAGMQYTGVLNVVDGDVKGVQGSGFINIARENVEGMQVSGFINIAKNVKGIQIGAINRADTVRGSQIGLINIADSVTGIPIGLINFVKNGYRSFDVSGSEGFHTVLSYNIGVNKFYQIVSVGIQMSDKTRWGLGLGLGTRFLLIPNRKMHAGFELMAHHINEESWTDKLNLLSQFKFKVHYQLSRQIGIFVAPTLNITVSQIYNVENNSYGTNFAPYSFFEDTTLTNRDFSTTITNTRVWAGGFIGISF